MMKTAVKLKEVFFVKEKTLYPIRLSKSARKVLSSSSRSVMRSPKVVKKIRKK